MVERRQQTAVGRRRQKRGRAVAQVFDAGRRHNGAAACGLRGPSWKTAGLTKKKKKKKNGKLTHTHTRCIGKRYFILNYIVEKEERERNERRDDK